jgi:hypothetical protein
MVPDDRSSVGGSQSGFDFNSQAGVLAVLAAIRASNLSAGERNELKDMVFLYSNGGKDAGVRAQLEQRLAGHAIVPVAGSQSASAQVQSVPKPVAGFASGRPAPMFGAPSLAQLPTPAPTPAPAPVAPPVAVAPIAPVIPLTPSTPVPATPAPQPQPQPQPQVVVVPVPVPPPAPAPVEAPAPAPAAPASVIPTDPASRLERIKKIKSDVNERVGNPVNLVDIDNVLGREYMSALLDAMKLLSTASEAESNTAMSRLESVYGEVMKRLAGVQSVVSSEAPVVATSAPIISPVVPEPVVRTIPVQSVEVLQNQSAPAVAPTPIQPPVVSTVPPPANLEPVLTPEQVKAAEAAWASSSSELDPLPQSAPVVPAVAPVVVPGAAVAPLVSVAASAAPLKTPSDLPSADSLQNSSVAGDPRYTKEVDDGLNQLLSEWTLFKKSGLFGTGPHGKDHPLFLKIANLQIPILLSGRFEGSTQEIKQSITDYMNGWRYEQGIIYDQGETFEQYLRRVIRHIIDLQNKRRAS